MLPPPRIIEVIGINRTEEMVIITGVEQHAIIGFVGHIMPHLALPGGIGARGDAIRISQREAHHLLIETDRNLALFDQFLLLWRATIEDLWIFFDASIRRGAARQ